MSERDIERVARAKCMAQGIDPDSTIMSGYYNDLTREEFAALDDPPHKVEDYPKIAWRTFRADASLDIAALTSAGLAVVPSEPTEAMLRAVANIEGLAVGTIFKWTGLDFRVARHVYKAMLQEAGK